jgi:hypothetical protein
VKITNMPPAWADKLLQVTLLAWDESKGTRDASPCATSDRGVFGKGRLRQNALVLLAWPDSPRAGALKGGKSSLPAGKYLVRMHVDLKVASKRIGKRPSGRPTSRARRKSRDACPKAMAT